MSDYQQYPQPSPEWWWKCIHCQHQWPLINPWGQRNGTQCKMAKCPAIYKKNIKPHSDKIWQ